LLDTYPKIDVYKVKLLVILNYFHKTALAVLVLSLLILNFQSFRLKYFHLNDNNLGRIHK